MKPDAIFFYLLQRPTKAQQQRASSLRNSTGTKQAKRKSRKALLDASEDSIKKSKKRFRQSMKLSCHSDVSCEQQQLASDANKTVSTEDNKSQNGGREPTNEFNQGHDNWAQGQVATSVGRPINRELIELVLKPASDHIGAMMRNQGYQPWIVCTVERESSVSDILQRLSTGWQRCIPDGYALYFQKTPEGPIALEGLRWQADQCNTSLKMSDIANVLQSQSTIRLLYGWNLSVNSSLVSSESSKYVSPRNLALREAIRMTIFAKQRKESFKQGCLPVLCNTSEGVGSFPSSNNYREENKPPNLDNCHRSAVEGLQENFGTGAAKLCDESKKKMTSNSTREGNQTLVSLLNHDIRTTDFASDKGQQISRFSYGNGDVPINIDGSFQKISKKESDERDQNMQGGTEKRLQVDNNAGFGMGQFRNPMFEETNKRIYCDPIHHMKGELVPRHNATTTKIGNSTAELLPHRTTIANMPLPEGMARYLSSEVPRTSETLHVSQKGAIAMHAGVINGNPQQKADRNDEYKQNKTQIASRTGIKEGNDQAQGITSAGDSRADTGAQKKDEIPPLSPPPLPPDFITRESPSSIPQKMKNEKGTVRTILANDISNLPPSILSFGDALLGPGVDCLQWSEENILRAEALFTSFSNLSPRRLKGEHTSPGTRNENPVASLIGEGSLSSLLGGKSNSSWLVAFENGQDVGEKGNQDQTGVSGRAFASLFDGKK